MYSIYIYRITHLLVNYSHLFVCFSKYKYIYINETCSRYNQVF